MKKAQLSERGNVDDLSIRNGDEAKAACREGIRSHRD